MIQWFKQWIRGPRVLEAAAPEERLARERQLQDLRLELNDRNRQLKTLHDQIERQQSQSNQRLDDTVQIQWEAFLAEAAAPVTQLITQAYLLEQAGRPVEAKDVMALAKRLIHLLQDHGLILADKVGDPVNYDPALHEPLSIELSIPAGAPAVIRFAGVHFRGKVLRRARVEPRDERLAAGS